MAHFAPSVQKKPKSGGAQPFPFQYAGCQAENPSFHRWSRHEQALFRAQRQLQTEHWTKMRCRSYGAMKLGSRVWIPHQIGPLSESSNVGAAAPADGETVAPIDSMTVDDYLRRRVHNPNSTRLPKQKPPTTTTTTPAKSSERAKLGFRYWYLDPLLYKRNPELKTNIGAKGTYFGISFPR